MRNNRIYLTAISVDRGVIQVIMQDGTVGLFAQRNISKLRDDEAIVAIGRGLIQPAAFGLRELPRNISISFEDAAIQGRAVASFNPRVLYDMDK